MGMGSQGCNEPTLGIFNNNWIWIILLILLCCGGFGNEGLGNVLGVSNWFGGNCTWLWIILAFYCCCSNSNRRCC